MPYSLTREYRTKDGSFDFHFRFVSNDIHIDIFVLKHPGFGGFDSSVHKTHLYADNRICFVSGREPRTQGRAEQLAAQWADYIMEYRRTGVAQQ